MWMSMCEQRMISNVCEYYESLYLIIYIYYGEYNNTGTYTADDIHIHALLLNVQIDEILMEMHGN